MMDKCFRIWAWTAEQHAAGARKSVEVKEREPGLGSKGCPKIDGKGSVK
jgi:hypothetical protein